MLVLQKKKNKPKTPPPKKNQNLTTTTKIKPKNQLFSFINIQNFQSFATCSSRTLSPRAHSVVLIDWSWFIDILQGTCNKFIPLCFHSWLHSIPGGNQPQTNSCTFPASAFGSTSSPHSSSTVILYPLLILH